jgi:hypothetical protein
MAAPDEGFYEQSRVRTVASHNEFRMNRQKFWEFSGEHPEIQLFCGAHFELYEADDPPVGDDNSS